ncbi:MAG TPA: GNAT family N-acetyltransferase [Gemmatimonadales bacterium]|nr:GNAT family N-acetyltransferase [Gemmatimonadales bacterium]
MIEIRSPLGQDLDGLFACLRGYHLHLLGDDPLADSDYPADALLMVRNRIAEIRLDTNSLVAVDGGEVLGFCCWAWYNRAEHAAKTVIITVSRAARERGVGSLLQQARMQRMWDEGAQSIHTWSADPASIAWYERHFGYRRLGREPIRHALHRFRWHDRVWWGLHRGTYGQDTLQHLVVEREVVLGTSS